MSDRPERERFLRFTVSDRLEHLAQMITFVPLAVTGLVQRYSGSGVSQGIIEALGGIEAVRIIHRVFAAILMVAVVYHVGAIGYRRYVLGLPRSMGLGRADMRAAGQSLLFNLGRRRSRPAQGRYTFEEKIEYWSLVWGTALMVITGFLLWNPVASATLLPGSFIPAAKAAHGAEAVLALLAVIVWHIYHVHIRRFNESMFTGYLPMEEMAADHPLELAAAGTRARPSHEMLRARRRKFLPRYGAGAAVFLAGIWLFVSFEDTALTTIEPIEDPVVFAPLTTTTLFTVTSSTVPATSTTDSAATASTTAAPVGPDLTWSDLASTFEEACGTCHVSGGLGGLSLATYDSALAGGNGGPGIEPGDPEASLVVTVMEEGGHPGQLDDDFLTALRAWIAAGAPEG